MQKLDSNELQLMDKLLALAVEEKHYCFCYGVVREKLDISEEEFQFLVDCIIEFNEYEQKIVNPMDKGETYQSFEPNYQTERFLKNGGFSKNHLSAKKEVMEFKNDSDKIGNAKSINIFVDKLVGETIIVGDNNSFEK